MLGKTLMLNLQDYLTPRLDIPVYIEDSNKERESPCVVLSFEEEQLVEGFSSHYKVMGEFNIYHHKDDDPDTVFSRSTQQALISALMDDEFDNTVTPSQPYLGAKVKQMELHGSGLSFEENTNILTQRFLAYCYNNNQPS